VGNVNHIIFRSFNMNLIEIPLSQLDPHPLNSNVMPEELLEKLAAHLARTGRYPPVIVRGTGGASLPARFQVLDGHHRVEALRRNGAVSARCVVWDVDDAEAMTLLATLNRLQGQDDPKKRARLIAAIQRERRVDLTQLSRELPEQVEQVRALVALNEPPRALPPRAINDLPAAVHFFLRHRDRARLERRLREVGGSREDALMKLIGADT
jgi:ParB-like chromosome segregation protein Spo0J